jgi:hypothetical protein
VTELVRDDPDAGVLGLHDVVVDLDAGARDGVAAGGRVDVAGVRPDGVGALGTTVVGLVGAGVDDHEVVDDAVGLEQVAVAVDVALVLDVVVGPGEAGVTGREGVDRVHHQLADLAGVVGVAGVGLDRLAAGGGAVVGLGVRHLDPAGDAAGDVVGALGHLAVVVLDGVAAQVDAGPAVGAGQVGPDPLGQAGLGVDELVVVAGAEVGHPEGVVVGAAAEGRRVGRLLCSGPFSSVPGGSVTQSSAPTKAGRSKPEKSSLALGLNSTRTVSSLAVWVLGACLKARGLLPVLAAIVSSRPSCLQPAQPAVRYLA